MELTDSFLTLLQNFDAVFTTPTFNTLVPVSQLLGRSANGQGVKIPLGGSTAKECASRKSPALTAVSQLD